MRSAVIGLFGSSDEKLVEQNAVNSCLCTHHDPRCVASSVAVALVVCFLLKNESVQVAIEKAQEISLERITQTAHKEDFNKCFDPKLKLEEIKCDERDKIGFVFKCLSVSIYALRNWERCEEVMNEILFEGGDADTNLSLAGALLGAKVGFSGLPKIWFKGLKHKKWLLRHSQSVYPFL